MNILQSLCVVLGGGGAFLFCLALFEGSDPERTGSVLSGLSQDEDREMRSFLMKVVASFQGDKAFQGQMETLQQRLKRAGYPYRDPAHYYRQMLIYAGVFGLAALLILIILSAFMISLPPLLILLIALLAGFWGILQPEDDLKGKLVHREEELVQGMLTSLQGLRMNYLVSGSLRAAIQQSSSSDRFDQSSVQEENQRRLDAGLMLAGFRNNLFTEALGTLSARLASVEISIQKALEQTAAAYPRNPYFESFLDTVAGGIRAEFEVEGRFDELLEDLRHTWRQKILLRSTRAKRSVILLSSLLLLVIFLIVLLPVSMLALNIFG